MRRRDRQRVDQGQRGLAFLQVVAELFAQFVDMARVIEYVIDDLEGLAQARPVACTASLGVGVSARQHCADSGRRLEQRGGLAIDHLHVARLGHRGIAYVEQLQDLALGDAVGGVCQDAHHAHAADANHHLEGARVKEVPDQHAGCIAESSIRCRAAATQSGLIDNVIVQQSRRMDELDGGSQFMLGGAAVTKRTADQQQDRRPQPLASRADDVISDGTDQHHIRIEAAADHRIDRSHVLLDDRVKVGGGERGREQGVGVGHDGLRTNERLRTKIIRALRRRTRALPVVSVGPSSDLDHCCDEAGLSPVDLTAGAGSDIIAGLPSVPTSPVRMSNRTYVAGAACGQGRKGSSLSRQAVTTP